MPTSATNNAVSSSSSNSASMALLPRKRPPRPSPVRDNAERIRSVKETLTSGATLFDSSTGGFSAVLAPPRKRSKNERLAGFTSSLLGD